MSVAIVLETHSVSTDNELGIATGWLNGRLSERGRRLAQELGERRRTDDIAAVFTSDLRRAVETAEIAFGGFGLSINRDPRLRECNFERSFVPCGDQVGGFELQAGSSGSVAAAEGDEAAVAEARGCSALAATVCRRDGRLSAASRGVLYGNRLDATGDEAGGERLAVRAVLLLDPVARGRPHAVAL